MANPNYILRWPLYKDANGIYIRGLPIVAITSSTNGSAVASFSGAYEDQALSAAFISTFVPKVGGYLFNSQHGEILYLSKTAFEAKYTRDYSESGYTLEAATPTTLGGVKQGAAVPDSAADGAPGFNDEVNLLLKSLRDAGIIAT